jgi:hypothetical protein
MGSAAGSGASIAGAGLGAWGSVVQAQGVQQGDIFKANMLEANAQRGEVAAVQTGGDYTRKLAIDLGNIDILRASAHTDPTSTTGAAIRDTNEQFGLTQKSIAVDNIMAQARQQEAEAAYLRSAGKSALLSGEISAGAGLLGAVGTGLSATPGGTGTPNVGSMLASAAGF